MNLEAKVKKILRIAVIPLPITFQDYTKSIPGKYHSHCALCFLTFYFI